MYRPYSSSHADSRPFRDVETLLRDQTQDFAMSFNTGNYDQAAALFAADGVLMAPQREPAYGPKPVERLLRQLGDAGYGDLRLETTRVDHSGDMAMELGRFTVMVRLPDGTSVPERGKYV
jgi:ketosteroid isomerase-like protein